MHLHPQVSLKDGASNDQLDAAKKQVTEQGGSITKEFKLVKGFAYAHTSCGIIYHHLHLLANDMSLAVPSSQQTKSTPSRATSTLTWRPIVR